MKRHGRAIVAALVFLILLGWALTKERGRAPQQGEAFGLDAKQATALQVKTDSSALTLQKQGDQWMLTEPVKGWADKDAVERMLKAIAELKPSGSRKDANINDPKFGLDKPKLTATLTHSGNKTVTVQLGNQVPGGSEYFAKIDNRNALYFVPTSLHGDLTQAAETLRDKSLAHFDKDKVKSVALQYPDAALTIEKRGTVEQPQWYLTQPYEAKADEWNAKQVAEKLASLKADGFAPEQPATGTDYGFAKPMLKATVTTEDNKTFVVTLGAKTMHTGAPSEPMSPGQPPAAGATQEVVYAQLEGRPEVLLIPSSQLADLKKTDMDLRDKRIVEMDKALVQELRVERKEGVSFQVRRLPDGWQLVTPSTGRANASKIDDLLWDLDELEAKAFLGEQTDLKPYGLALPETVITITQRGLGDPVKVYVGYKKSDGIYYAKTSKDNQVFEISEMLLLDMPKTAADLKEVAGATPAPATGAGPAMPAMPAPPGS